MQLVEDPDTTLMNTMKHEIFNEDKVFEKFGVKPSQIRDMLALVGDSSDNIPGVPKVGQKTAAKWLNEYGNLEGIISNADSIKGVVGDNLRNCLDDLDRNIELVSLKEDVDLNLKFEDLLIFVFSSADPFRISFIDLLLVFLLSSAPGFGILLKSGGSTNVFLFSTKNSSVLSFFCKENPSLITPHELRSNKKK